MVRYSLHIGSNAWLEIQWYLFSAIFLLAASHTLRRNEHVRIDILAGKLPQRVQVAIDIVGFSIFVLPMCFIVVTYSVPYVMESFAADEISMNAGGLTVWPVKVLIPISFVMLFAQGVSEIIKRIGFLFNMVDASAFEKQSRDGLETSKAELEAALVNRPGGSR